MIISITMIILIFKNIIIWAINQPSIGYSENTRYADKLEGYPSVNKLDTMSTMFNMTIVGHSNEISYPTHPI